jgi:hypothetical protein
MADFDAVKHAKREVEAELLARPGVTGVGVGFKEAGGELTDEIAIRVYVENKRVAEQLAAGEAIPAEIGGHRTDVIESSRPRHAVPSDYKRPVPAGYQFQVIGIPNAEYGTTGCFVTKNPPGSSAPVYMLTCYHILFPAGTVWQDWSVNQPSFSPDPTTRFNKIGDAQDDAGDAKYGGEVDAALVELLSGTQYENYAWRLGWIHAAEPGYLGDVVWKHGMTTLRTCGKIVDADFSAVWPGGVTLTGQLRIQFTAQGSDPGQSSFCQQGDSGAAVIKYGSNGVVLLAGLLCGYAEAAGGDAIANEINNVFSALGVTLATLGQTGKAPS